MRKGTLVFGSIISLVFLTSVASATSITPGGATLPLGPGSDYHAALTSDDVGTGFFTHDYRFDVPTNVTTTLLVSSHQPFPDPGDPEIDNLTLSWLDSTGHALPGPSSIQVTDAHGQTIGSKLIFTLAGVSLAGADYILRVIGTASNAGRYDFDLLGSPPAVVGQAPLPASAWLFGSAMVCLGVLMRRRAGSKSA